MELTLDLLRDAEDLDLGASDWIRIDQERIDAFAEATEDRQWIHTDPARAAASRFGGTIAHGYLLLSLIPRLFSEVFHLPGLEMVVNYGLDKVRFIQPVPSGSEIRLECVLTKVIERGDTLLARVRGDLVLRESGRRAVVADTLFLLVPPTPDDAEG
ncbi:MAG: MaoC family dehydratase [Acidobacteriota bacterium]